MITYGFQERHSSESESIRPRNNTNLQDEKFILALVCIYCGHDKMAATRASYEKSMPSATTNINR